jgi:hypothetical protein
VNRLREDSVKGDGPRLITPGIFGSTTISSILPNTQNLFNKTTSNHLKDQSDTPWLILKPLSDTRISSSSNKVPNVISNKIVAPAVIHSSTSHVNNLPKILHVTPHVTSPIPWVILKSPVSERHTTRFSSTTVLPSTAAKKPATKSAGPSSTRVSTVRPTSPTVRQETKQQSTTTRKSGTKVSLTTKSPVLNGPNSNSKAATNGVRPL